MPQSVHLSALVQEVTAIGCQAAGFIRSHFGRVQNDEVEEKSHNSLVSFVDKEAEQQIVDRLRPLLPEAGFIAEENQGRVVGEIWNWVIDPLDGTTNFLHGIPHFCVSIGLVENSEVMLGVVVDAVSGSVYSAVRGQGAYRDGVRISIDQRPALEASLFATGFPYAVDYDMEAHMKILSHFLVTTRGLRRLGSAALDLCRTAAGEFGFYFESYLNAWDYAAGSLIAEEAGCWVGDFGGGRSFLETGQILACVPGFEKAVLPVLAPLHKKKEMNLY